MESVIERYLDEVCSYIKFKEVHEEVKEELRCHIQEFVEELVDRGIEEEEAVKKVIKSMGSSDLVGERLNKVHKDKIDWISLIIISFLSILGVVSIYFISLSHVTRDEPVVHAMSYMRVNIFYSCLGIILLGIFYIWDIRKLKKYSFLIFFGVIVLFGCVMVNRNTMNGRLVLSLGSNISISLYPLVFLFILSSCGILDIVDWEKRRNLWYGFLITIVPVVILMICKSTSLTFVYLTIILTLIFRSNIRTIDKIIILLGSLIPVFVFLGSSEYFINSMLKQIDYMNNIDDYGFIRYRIHYLLKDVKMFGNGFHIQGLPLPVMESSFIMVYIIISLGWVGFGFVVSMIGVLFFRIINKIGLYNNRYLKNISLAFFLLLFIQALLHILGSLNLIPTTFHGLMPFVSYGRTNILLSFTAFGFILSSYRRRNLKLESRENKLGVFKNKLPYLEVKLRWRNK
ncbi:FtsW/RodA/SpoVE family cell cycle protein [Oceanirhabdus sp. W0125-5]|uniref:FtsW/RodA/SpoVE family cell cycle protein n=1 Tax=Oceanirhabdus sp. W0125-5 TaxID=2999116 RepID=UPI0022F2B950|nr:FtsW/RodA/SpoVE family cell cycle protein [Oceanirhabdus sp. W0125-5]WBW96521.1 FtsW/RodA/SpoVE family cell cycle protein [Oceanirhabdus sp. W0125-5]